MAQAWVRFVSTAGYGGTTPQSFFYEVTFFGADVPLAVATGQQLEISAGLGSPLTWTMLKTQVISAVHTRAAALGLTISNAEIFIDTYELGIDVITTIPNLKVWLDASQITGLVDGDPVGTWIDQSGNGYDATQSVAAKKPTYKTNVLNARPVVRYDGVDDDLGTSLSVAQPITLLAVIKHLSGSVTGNQSVAVGDVSTYGLLAKNATPDTIALFGGSLLTGGTLDANAHVVIGVLNGVSSLIDYDGVVTSGDAGTGGITTVLKLGGVWSGQALSMDLAEIVVYNHAVTQAERESLRSYAGNKWGVLVP